MAFDQKQAMETYVDHLKQLRDQGVIDDEAMQSDVDQLKGAALANDPDLPNFLEIEPDE